MSEEHLSPRVLINSNTYVSLGLLALVGGGLIAILTSLSSAKEEVRESRRESNNRFEKLELRMTTFESNKNVVTSTEFFKWAVHLQQANPQIKVPEPEVVTK